ncbi:MgtC/SapB family protein [Virgibacillus halotolerans]|uniref:MgtC/SapB family protein n=1 Tax=Virgibacillus halotolerans TaxID=1071053 RepID=UPI001961D29A
MEMFDWEMLLRLVISAVLGLAIGLEREFKRKPLGLKTSLVIAIVSCLLTIVSIQSAYLFPNSDYILIQMDPLRLAAQIVSGIGFLGAGVILRREDDTITGLTTAAMIWGAAGIGIATGAGFYIEAIAGVSLLLVSVELIPSLIKRMGIRSLRSKELSLRVNLRNREDIEEVITKIEKMDMEVKNTRIKDLKEGSYLIALNVRVNYERRTSDVYHAITKIDKVNTVEISG